MLILISVPVMTITFSQELYVNKQFKNSEVCVFLLWYFSPLAITKCILLLPSWLKRIFIRPIKQCIQQICDLSTPLSPNSLNHDGGGEKGLKNAFTNNSASTTARVDACSVKYGIVLYLMNKCNKKQQNCSKPAGRKCDVRLCVIAFLF